MPRKYIVTLTDEEQHQLKKCISKGKNSARTIRRAHILLYAEEGLKNEEIVSRVKGGLATVSRTKQRYVEGGLNRALVENPRSGQPEKLNGKAKAHLVAIACSEPPDGRFAWTLRLLGDQIVELNLVDSISPNCVRRYLKKTNVSLGNTSNGALAR